MVYFNGLVRVGPGRWVRFPSLLECVLDRWVGQVRLSMGSLVVVVILVVWVGLVCWMGFQVGIGVVNANKVVWVGLDSLVGLRGLVEWR